MKAALPHALAVALVLLAASPALPQEMTPAEEAAYTALMALDGEAKRHFYAGNLVAAEDLFRQQLEIINRDLPNEPLTLAATLDSLAATMSETGRLTEAETVARQALALREANGAVINALTSSRRLLASILNDLEAYPEARDLMSAVVEALLSDAEMDRTDFVADYAMFASVTASSGDLPAAMALIGQLEPLVPDLQPAEAVATFTTLGRLSSLSGHPDRAEAAYREALNRSDAIPAGGSWGPKNRAILIGNLASMLLRQGRFTEAEPLFRQAGSMLPPAVSDRIRANLLNGLGMALAGQGLYQDAYDAQRLGLDALLVSLPPEHPRVGAAFATIGETLLRAGQPAIARQALEHAVTIQQAAGDTLRAGRSLLTLAAVMGTLGEGQTALTMATDGRDMMVATLPPGHPDLIRAAFNQSWLALAAGDAAVALPLARAALADYVSIVSRVGADATIASAQEPDMRRQVLAVTAAAWDSDPDSAALLDEAFRAAQWAQNSQAARATQRMSARFAAGSGELAALARRKQDLVNLWLARDAEYLDALARPGETAPRDTGALEQELAALDADLAARYPAYAALVSPGVLSVPEIQTLLTPGEALIMAVPTFDETYIFAVSPTSASWTRAALTSADLDAAIRQLRADLDPNAPTRTAAALDDAPAPQGKSYDRTLAYQLYSQLFAPLQPVFQGADTLLVVADGPLSSLPLQVLVTSSPVGEDTDPRALRETNWFVKSHAFATLPGVSSLKALRSHPHGSAATSFVGFGAPTLTGQSATPAPLARFFDGGTARLEAVRALAPLPGTRRELLGLAKVLSAPQGAVRLGAAATEAALRSAPDLADARILALATHGLLAGDITGLSEPALVFTPPDGPGTSDDDGLLTASEAAQLDLDADWVILSACNTAASDGTPGAEGLSGLASAFLYAGAQSVLVSHWPVRDDAAASLTQGAVTAQANTGQNRAAALQASALALIADTSNSGFAHPSAWGPFVLVGEPGD